MSQKVAYVTGGMGGIGTAICQRLHVLKIFGFVVLTQQYRGNCRFDLCVAFIVKDRHRTNFGLHKRALRAIADFRVIINHNIYRY